MQRKLVQYCFVYTSGLQLMAVSMYRHTPDTSAAIIIAVMLMTRVLCTTQHVKQATVLHMNAGKPVNSDRCLHIGW